MLTDEIESCEAKAFLTSINGTDYNYLEEHMFNEEGSIIGYGNPFDFVRNLLNAPKMKSEDIIDNLTLYIKPEMYSYNLGLQGIFGDKETINDTYHLNYE